MTSPAIIVDRVSKVFSGALHEGCVKAFYFILGDYVERNLQYGLIHNDMTPRPAYVAFGPIFHTSSKREPEPSVGLSALAEASRRCRRAGVPLLAIGGLSLASAPAVALLADLGAVISALLPEGGLAGVTQATADLHAALGGR